MISDDTDRTPLNHRGNRPWHALWPPGVPLTLDSPRLPAWWLLERNVGSFGSRVALRELDPSNGSEDRTTTYEQLYRAARGTAAGLGALGVTRASRVAFVLPNGRPLIVGYFATWLAGAVTVPANPLAPERELEAQLVDADVAVIVGETGSAAEAVAGTLRRRFVDRDSFDALATEPPIATPSGNADDLAVLLYTGGTTGPSKGVMLTHRNLVANCIQFAGWYAFERGDEVCVAALPMFHSGGMSGAMTVPLYAGATLLVFGRFQAPAVARAVSRYRATRLFGVPTMYIALMRDDEGRRADYSSLRACRTNAAPLPPAIKRAFDEMVGREVLIEAYGLTEASPLTHANPIMRARPGSIGIPLPDTDARIIDLDTGKDCPTGTAGELLVRGPQVMAGYWRRPGETSTALANGWLHTGDVAVMEGDGYFSIVSRTKDIINTAGFKVWPREVEDVLYGHPAVRMAAVIGVPDEVMGEKVGAVIIPRPGQQLEAAEVAAFARTLLADFKVPQYIVIRAK